VGQVYLPEELKKREYYKPKEIGHEKAIKERLDKIKKKKTRND
jgi:replication-associated recombination protein RarA